MLCCAALWCAVLCADERTGKEGKWKGKQATKGQERKGKGGKVLGSVKRYEKVLESIGKYVNIPKNIKRYFPQLESKVWIGSRHETLNVHSDAHMTP